MPLFGRKTAEPVYDNTPTHTTAAPKRNSMFSSRREPEPVQTTAPKRNSTLFGRKRSVSPVGHHTNGHHTNGHHTTTSTSPPRHGGLLHRNHEDPSIVGARQRVMSAEAAEKEADQALMRARAMVREARDDVKRLEREAAEEARLAKIKQTQAKAIGKRGKALGRHDHI